MDIAEFLLARIEDDEMRARSALPWATGSREERQPVDWVIHTRRWPPARVLAECEAKRRIVELESCYACSDAWTPCEHRNSTLRLLALPYAGHPDYQSEWSPQVATP